MSFIAYSFQSDCRAAQLVHKTLRRYLQPARMLCDRRWMLPMMAAGGSGDH